MTLTSVVLNKMLCILQKIVPDSRAMHACRCYTYAVAFSILLQER
jgi:hypothetical protein